MDHPEDSNISQMQRYPPQLHYGEMERAITPGASRRSTRRSIRIILTSRRQARKIIAQTSQIRWRWLTDGWRGITTDTVKIIDQSPRRPLSGQAISEFKQKEEARAPGSWASLLMPRWVLDCQDPKSPGHALLDVRSDYWEALRE